MKKFLAILLLLSISCLLLTSCAKTLSGVYSAEILVVGKISYQFSGHKVTCATTADLGVLGSQTETVSGTYEIVSGVNGDEITFTWVNEDGTTSVSTYSFEEDAETGDIKIAGIPYTKQYTKK